MTTCDFSGLILTGLVETPTRLSHKHYNAIAASIWKKPITDLNMSGKSLEAISKQLQVPRSTVVCKFKVHGTVVSLPRSGRKHKLSPCCWERAGQRGQESSKQTLKKQVCNHLEAAGRQVSVSAVEPVFALPWAERLLLQDRGFCSRRSTLKLAAAIIPTGGSAMLWGCFAASGSAAVKKV